MPLLTACLRIELIQCCGAHLCLRRQTRGLLRAKGARRPASPIGRALAVIAIRSSGRLRGAQKSNFFHGAVYYLASLIVSCVPAGSALVSSSIPRLPQDTLHRCGGAHSHSNHL
jgi:hypothetical protein